MPYIDPRRRKELAAGGIPVTAGELNYQFTRELNLYVEKTGLSYNTINDIIGALEGAKQEFYFRVARPYEDEKIKQNGDVYAKKEGVQSSSVSSSSAA